MIELSESSRVILYYNGAISALTLFLQHPDESVCSPSPLPALSSVLEEGEMPLTIALMAPVDMAAAISKIMGLPADLLQANMGYHEQVDTLNGVITVYLAYFNVLDPPRQLMAEKGCKFRTLTELRNRPPAEMELLRRAYALVMES
ncbi:MAG: hypothetical protein PHO08_04535 [Methylococcales bacterium]|nr:hypothetical protein [Methylococcales bacterium]